MKNKYNKAPWRPEYPHETTQKYNVCLNGFTLSQDILCEMPIWYHIKLEATRRMFNGGEQVKCLQMHHKVKTIKEVENTYTSPEWEQTCKEREVLGVKHVNTQ